MDRQIKNPKQTTIKNAFKILLISEKIFNYCNFVDKKSLRLVNKLCRNSTLEAWRKCASFAIRFDFKWETNYPKWSNQFTNHYLVSMKCFEDFTEPTKHGQWPFLQRLDTLPFRSFSIFGGSLWLPTEHTDANNDDGYCTRDFFKLVHFLTKFGFNLECLKIAHCEFSVCAFQFIIEFIVKKACPKLQKLSIDVCLIQPQQLGKHASLLLPTLQDASSNYKACNLKELTLSIDGGSFSSLGNQKFENIWKYIFTAAPNVKILKCSALNGLRSPTFYQILRDRPKNLKRKELEVCFKMCLWRYYEFESLSECFEVAPPQLDKFRIILQFLSSKYFGISWPDNVPAFHDFFIRNGTLVTDVEIKLPEDVFPPQLKKYHQIVFMTGHYFPNLTHLTLMSCGNYRIFLDFECFKGMPNLVTFRYLQRDCSHENHCKCYPLQMIKLIPEVLKSKHVLSWRHGLEEAPINNVYKKSTIQLNNLKEFSYHSASISFDTHGLKTVLTWIKNVKKLVLNLDNDTFPIVFDMLPELNELVLTGQSTEQLTEAEHFSGICWMTLNEKQKQMQMWRERLKRKERETIKQALEFMMSGKEVMTRAKERAQREKRKRRMEKIRDQIEEDEMAWIQSQIKIEGGERKWTFVSYKKKQKRRSDNISLPDPNQNAKLGVNDSLIFAKLLPQAKQNITQIRIFRNSFNSFDHYIEYKVGKINDNDK